MTTTLSVMAGNVCTCCDMRMIAVCETNVGRVMVCPDCDYAGSIGPVSPRPRTPAAPPLGERWVNDRPITG